MAKIPTSRVVRVDLPDGTAKLMLREPSIEELNKYQIEYFDVPPGATGKDAMKQRRKAQEAFFDLLLLGVEDLETAEGVPVTPDMKDKIPANWKHDAIFQNFDRSPVSIEKN